MQIYNVDTVSFIVSQLIVLLFIELIHVSQLILYKHSSYLLSTSRLRWKVLG